MTSSNNFSGVRIYFDAHLFSILSANAETPLNKGVSSARRESSSKRYTKRRYFPCSETPPGITIFLNTRRLPDLHLLSCTMNLSLS